MPYGVFILFVIGIFLANCRGVRPYEKEYLLLPVMDDQLLERLDHPLMSSQASSIERLGSSGLGLIGGTSCPTCGS
jgi:hypothetical protein